MGSFSDSFVQAAEKTAPVAAAGIMDIIKQKIQEDVKSTKEKAESAANVAAAIQAANSSGNPALIKMVTDITHTVDANGTAKANPLNVEASKAVLTGVMSAMKQPDPATLALKQDTLQLRQDTADNNQWQKLIKSVDPQLASSRSTIGMAANANLRADRALVTLNNPLMTYQDAQNVVGDIAGIYQGGAPTDQGMKHSQYQTVQSQLASLQQSITGKPTDALPKEIRNHIKGVLSDLKSVNNDAISNHVSFLEKANSNLISKFPDEWNQVKQSLGATSAGSAPTKTIGSTTYEKRADGKWYPTV